ncbi:MAG: citrate lyase holo-[Oscillospiraceae bacterium]|nr:citrate lyase holo-[acyl-carrier protein] synthase [Oscillospiraceae bacterium]
MIEQEITLSEILTAREERVAIQNALLSEYKTPVISFTMNIAGPVKVTALSHRAFLWGMDQLRLGFLQNKMQVKKEFSRNLPTGDEGYFAIDAPAERVKALCVEIEEANSMGRMGRLFDMDVIGLDGKKLERGTERPCIVCGKPGRDCASRRLHSVAELQLHTAALLRSGLWFAAQNRIAVLATRALLDEVAVTPKPGLVDRANNGAHRDMDFSSFQASAAALAPYWAECFRSCHSERSEESVLPAAAWERRTDPSTPLRSAQDDKLRACAPAETFAKLRPLGKQAERDMLAATGGVNTHKGAIFTLGVLCGAIGRLWTAENGFPEPEAILDEAAAMTRETLEQELPAAHWNTAGEALYRKYGARGIRGQVSDGLPAVREISLPVFKKLLADGLDRNHAAAVTLLHLIANVEDTNLLHRGGPEGATWAKEKAAELLSSGAPSLEEIAELDRQFIQRNLSPGGCADLLAVTLFLESLHS